MNKSHKESALGFLKSVASGQVREAYALYVGTGFNLKHVPLNMSAGWRVSILECRE